MSVFCAKSVLEGINFLSGFVSVVFDIITYAHTDRIDSFTLTAYAGGNNYKKVFPTKCFDGLHSFPDIAFMGDTQLYMYYCSEPNDRKTPIHSSSAVDKIWQFI